MNAENIKSEVFHYLTQRTGFPKISLEQADHFNYLSSKALDSLGMVELIAFVEEKYQIEFSAEEMESEEFQSIGGLASIISRKK